MSPSTRVGVERPPLQLRFLGFAELLLQRVAHGGEVVDRAGHFVAGRVALDIVGAGFEPGLEHPRRRRWSFPWPLADRRSRPCART